MKKTCTIFLALMIVANIGFSQTSPEIDYRALNEKLFGHLERVGNNGKTNRLVAGGILSGLGLLALNYNSYLGYDDIIGALFLGIGSINLFVPSTPERAYKRYIAYPEGTEAELEMKVKKGEKDLEKLSRSSAIVRIFGSGIMAACGFYSIIYVNLHGRGYFPSDLFEIALLSASIFDFIIIRIPEKEWNNYKKERDKQ